MLTPSYINAVSFFYPMGNTPAVCLTEALPPNVPADILLLGCGDLRNVLFTRHIDANRKLDVTCCDNQKAVIARNVLLLSFVIDQKHVRHDDSVWSIYYHMYIDKKALGLLRSQAQILYKTSVTMDAWQQSRYGSLLAFCDSASLADVRGVWEFYCRDRSPAEHALFKDRFESVLREAKERRAKTSSIVRLRSVVPAHLGSLKDMITLHEHYWNHGTTELDTELTKHSKHPNPTILTMDVGAAIHYNSDPLAGYHLALAYAPLPRDGPISMRLNPLSQFQKIVALARMEFGDWLASYGNHRASIKMRFSTADAVSLAHTIQHKHLTGANTAYWYRRQYSSRPLVLDGPDYTETNAPLNFDVIDTSNLCDHMGPLVLLTATSPLLRNHISSSLYTEVLSINNEDGSTVLDNLLCGDVPTLSSLLGLFPVEYWTNTTSTSLVDRDLFEMLAAGIRGATEDSSHGSLRICWKRPLAMNQSSDPHPAPTAISFDSDGLAKALHKVYTHMFRDEDYGDVISSFNLGRCLKAAFVWYHRASFASFMRLVQTRVSCDWEAAMKSLLKLIVKERERSGGTGKYDRGFLAGLYIMNLLPRVPAQTPRNPGGPNEINTVSSLDFPVPSSSGKMASIWTWKSTPQVICVTLRIPRTRLEGVVDICRRESFTPFVHCVVEYTDLARGWGRQNVFPACQLVFGKISTSGTPYDDSFQVSVAEDEAGWYGTSDLSAIFYAPARVFRQDPRKTKVWFGMHETIHSAQLFRSMLGPSLTLFETNADNSAFVYITRYGPNQTQYSIAPGLTPSQSETSTATGARSSMVALVEHETGRICRFTGRLDITTDDMKVALINGCLVQRSTLSPCQVAIKIGQTESLTLSFPVFVLESSQRVRVSRKSAWIEVVATVAGAHGWMDYPQYMYPIHFQQGEPRNWTVPYITIEACPVIDKDQKSRLPWLELHLSTMLSARERLLSHRPQSFGEQLRSDFKRSLCTILGQFGEKCRVTCITGTIDVYILGDSLRMDRANRTVVLDCAVIHMSATTKKLMPGLCKLLQMLTITTGAFIEASDAEISLWRHALPAFVERCRTWSHRETCEYKRPGATIPLPAEGTEGSLCTCGYGVFPPDFMADFQSWESLARLAVRAAIAPTFWAPFTETAYIPDLAEIRRGF
ncbi:hypothetical protein GGS20DRAFT_596429 [Poronia punctata]|nr:hypothetical protein GGS20DRAFT_596429 [Poronia punctata]